MRSPPRGEAAYCADGGMRGKAKICNEGLKGQVGPVRFGQMCKGEEEEEGRQDPTSGNPCAWLAYPGTIPHHRRRRCSFNSVAIPLPTTFARSRRALTALTSNTGDGGMDPEGTRPAGSISSMPLPSLRLEAKVLSDTGQVHTILTQQRTVLFHRHFSISDHQNA